MRDKIRNDDIQKQNSAWYLYGEEDKARLKWFGHIKKKSIYA